MRRGVNIYEEARLSFGKVNESERLENFSNSSNPSIFLSHRSSDKAAVKEIGEYIKDAGINVYIDIDDRLLQLAVASDTRCHLMICFTMHPTSPRRIAVWKTSRSRKSSGTTGRNAPRILGRATNIGWWTSLPT